MKRSRKRLQRKSNKRRSRIARNKFVPPRTAEEFFAMSERDQDSYADAMHVVTDMRTKGTSLNKASREYRRDPRLVLKWARPSLRKRAGRYVPRAKVEQLRVLVMAAAQGNREIAVHDFPQATQIGKHWIAIDRALGPEEDDSALRAFEGKYIMDISGEQVPFLTDLAELKRQYSAGNLSFETIYARRA